MRVRDLDGLVGSGAYCLIRGRARTRGERRERHGFTGLLTRRHFLDLAADAAVRCARDGRPIGLLVIDVDRFKQINDRHGHLAGDDVLSAVASRCRGVLRDGDLLCRYGGDELVALLPGAAGDDADVCGARIVTEVRSSPIVVGRAPLQVTVSVGAATRHGPVSIEELLDAADTALYAVKQAGRDGVRLAELPAVRRAG